MSHINHACSNSKCSWFTEDNIANFPEVCPQCAAKVLHIDDEIYVDDEEVEEEAFGNEN